MGEYQLDAVLGAVADPTRRAILDRLLDGEARVTDLAREFPISLNSTSKHIKVLERAELVHREVRGREHVLSLRAESLGNAVAWMQRYQAFWEDRLAALEAFVMSDESDVAGEPDVAGETDVAGEPAEPEAADGSGAVDGGPDAATGPTAIASVATGDGSTGDVPDGDEPHERGGAR
ncbi:DNA-binding transcriptional regulator, ArsR family [Agromyces sp. CF514]|uniref:ArsR/SmtB family transcription factor n=1 Tax=Agromyces sp. CF514 TaxID=1881031 RepID=UPI0008F22778|nr:metalloregulator ArsR/SmtB family transcription factor [Agromyces sp. CF514]SFR70711.1 DNA-binding transcriptional regulator, ArsR family [Agromyces sp. CF514]